MVYYPFGSALCQIRLVSNNYQNTDIYSIIPQSIAQIIALFLHLEINAGMDYQLINRFPLIPFPGLTKTIDFVFNTNLSDSLHHIVKHCRQTLSNVQDNKKTNKMQNYKEK